MRAETGVGRDGATPGTLRASRLLLALACSAVIALIAVSAAGVRGSDQFWYVADVETIARGEGIATNTVFPATLLQTDAGPPYRPIHNQPILYLVALLARLLGGYGAWVVLNVAAVLGSALLVRALLVPRVGEPLANLAAALFAVLPAAFWQAGQPLADAAIGFLVMLCVWSLCRSRRLWPLAFASLLCAALSREVFALPLVLLPWLYWRWADGETRGKMARAAGMLVLAAAVLLVKGRVHPQQLELSLAETAWRLLATGAGDMDLFFDLEPGTAPTLVELLGAASRRLGRALSEHLVPPWRQSIFYLPFNLLAAIVLSGWRSLRRDPAGRPLLLVCGALLALHLLTLTLMHASFRYGFVITGPLLVAAAVRLRHRLRPGSAVTMSLWAAALAALLCVDLALAHKNRREGILVRELTAASRPLLERVVGRDQVVAFEAANLAPGVWYLWASHALPSSTVLFLHPGFPYDPPTYERLLRHSGAGWLICRAGSPLRESLRADPEPVARLPEPASGWRVYRLAGARGASGPG